MVFTGAVSGGGNITWSSTPTNMLQGTLIQGGITITGDQLQQWVFGPPLQYYPQAVQGTWISGIDYLVPPDDQPECFARIEVDVPWLTVKV